MIKYSLLIKNIKQYYKLCLASLESDMAKRIMFSAIPSVAPIDEVALTKGIVDYKALDAAIEGRKDMLKYGTEACLNEFQYFNDNKIRKLVGDKLIKIKEEKSNLLKTIEKFYNEENFVQALTLMFHNFMKVDSWNQSFGGLAWGKIAETLLRIASLDKTLAFVQEYKKKGYHESKEAVDAEIKIKRDIITYMNVFDGLAHNTASVMENLVELEHKDIFKLKEDDSNYYGSLDQSDILKLIELIEEYNLFDLSIINTLKEISEKYNGLYYSADSKKILKNLNYLMEILNKIDVTELPDSVKTDVNQLLNTIKFDINNKEKEIRSKRINRLMDAKELKSTFDVYREIKPVLNQSGEINRFKDWTGKLESHPEYKQHNPDFVEAEILLIKFKKAIMAGKKHLKDAYKEIRDLIDSEEKNIYSILLKIEDIKLKIINNTRYISQDLNSLIRSAPEQYSDEERANIINIVSEHLKNSSQELNELNLTIYSDINQINLITDINQLKEKLNIINNNIAEFISIVENMSLKKQLVLILLDLCNLFWQTELHLL